MKFVKHTISISLCIVLFGCGGGGGSSSTAPVTTNPPPTTTTGQWVAGQYAASESLRHQCEVPRTGIDQYNNNQPYPDQAGSALLEKLWLRSYSHETYLWFNELADNDPNLYETVFDYFNQLKTTATTPSGKPKDSFHFFESYEDYAKESQAGVASGYGVRWAFVSNKPPRVLRVAYTQSGSVADQAGLKRGDTILAIDNVDINDTTETGVATLNQGLNPTSGTTHTFKVRSNAGIESDVTLIAGDVLQTPVQNNQVIEHNDKSIGYLQFNQFISVAQPELIKAVEQFKAARIDALVLDMRYNGGGLLALSSQLGYMVAGPGRTSNRIFNQSIDNGKGNVYENDNQRISGFYNREIDYVKLEFTSRILPDLDLNTVYILTSGSTCSASESLINGLRGVDVNVVQIGNTTCGKPYGFFPTPNCGSVFYTIQFKSSNEKGFGDYADGFKPTPTPVLETDVPGCQVADDFDNALGSKEERLLKTALNHISTGSCPVSTARPTAAASVADNQGIGLEIHQSVQQSNAIYTPIKD